MSVWDVYQDRISTHGDSKHNASFLREVRFLGSKLPDSLSYHSVDVYPSEYSYNIDSYDSVTHRFQQNVAIVDSDNLDEKTIYSLPNEDISLGALIFWMDNFWIVYERDANATLYTRAKLLQCNHLLKWITDDNEFITQWCVVEDGTKYMTGEAEDRDFVVTRGDSRIAVQLSKNKYSSELNRENRFLVDDDDSPHKLAYQLTKPLKTGMTYNGEGTFKFILQEVTATEYDNHELGIADYYLHFPKDLSDNDEDGVKTSDSSEASPSDEGKKVWI